MNEKEKVEGLSLQISAIFARLEALRNALPDDCKEKYIKEIEQRKQSMREKYNLNGAQLEEWYQ